MATPNNTHTIVTHKVRAMTCALSTLQLQPTSSRWKPLLRRAAEVPTRSVSADTKTFLESIFSSLGLLALRRSFVSSSTAVPCKSLRNLTNSRAHHQVLQSVAKILLHQLWVTPAELPRRLPPRSPLSSWDTNKYLQHSFLHLAVPLNKQVQKNLEKWCPSN